MVRERLAEVIAHEKDLALCGQAESRSEALDVIQAAQPELVVIDLSLKASNGLDLVKDIRARWPGIRMLVVSMHDESLYAERVIRAGARGYITKQQATRDILTAIRTVLGGELYLNPKAASQIVARITGNPAAPGAHPADVLTDRERQVFELTGHGLSIRQIASQLHIEPKTVETYRARIKDKLGLGSGSDLLQLAIRWNRED
ncbi:MAG: response regulator transcription factor [Verrucomicrobia bacterium]|nr:response regulator transcription factor [Verrucomicrobiota bacterium]